eukprot:5876455-Pyramimonas_sp.AAC.1
MAHGPVSHVPAHVRFSPGAQAHAAALADSSARASAPRTSAQCAGERARTWQRAPARARLRSFTSEPER